MLFAAHFTELADDQFLTAVEAVIYAHHITNNIVFQYVHNIIVNIVSDLRRVPPRQVLWRGWGIAALQGVKSS